MPQYDGSIRINTEIDTNEAEKELQGLKESISSAAKETNQEAQKMGEAFSETAVKISDLQSKMDSLRDQKIPTQEYTELQKQIESTENKLLSLYDKQERFLAIGGSEDSMAYKGMAYDAEMLDSKLQRLEQDMQMLVDSGKDFTLGKDTDQYAKYEQQIAQLQAKEDEKQAKEEARINALQAKEEAKRAKEEAAIQAQEAEEQRLAQIRENAVVGNQQIVESLERIKQLEQEIADLKKAGVTEGYEDYDSRIKELSELKVVVKDYNANIGKTKESYKKLGDTAKQSFGKVNKSAQKSGGILKTMASRFKGLALSLLIFNQISKAFRAMSNAIKEGFGNLYNDNEKFKNSIDSLKTSTATLKNAFAAAFKPLVEIAVPYIQKAIEYLTMLADKFAQFMSAVTGQKTYTKAIKQTTAALKDENKESNKQLSSLDKLNNLSSGGGGADSSGAAGTMFEEVPIDEQLPSIFQQMAEYAEKLKDIFSQGFWGGLGDWEYRWESIKESIGSIKDSLIDIWTDPAVLSAADGYNKSVAYMLGNLAGSAVSIGLTVATNLLGGISKYLEQNSDRIKEFIVSMFDIGSEINYLIADFSQAFAYIFEAFASDDAQQLTANLIGIFTDAFMGVMEIAGKLARDILNIFIQPFVDNKEAFRTALEGFLSVLSEVTGTIKQGIGETFDNLNEVYDEHFKPFFDSIADGLSDTVGKFMEFWNGSVQPILNEWAADFDQLWKEHIQPMLNKFVAMLGDVADFLKAVWENVLKPLIDWIIENVLPVLLPIIDGVVKALKSAAGMIADVVGGIIDVVSGILQFLTGVFTGDWEKAWGGIVKIFDGVWGAIKGIVNGILGVVESLANGVIKGMNIVIGAFNGLHFDIPDWVPLIGGESFGFNIPELSQISIPRLATGTVVPPNREFMAMLGDNKREPEVVSPISTMKQAVLEAIAEAGGMGGAKEINLNLTVECEGYRLLQLLQKLDLEQYNRTGRPSFQM